MRSPYYTIEWNPGHCEEHRCDSSKRFLVNVVGRQSDRQNSTGQNEEGKGGNETVKSKKMENLQHILRDDSKF